MWAVSLEPVPAMTGIVTASATARHRSSFSSSVSDGRLAGGAGDDQGVGALVLQPPGHGGGGVEVEPPSASNGVTIARGDLTEPTRHRSRPSCVRSMPSEDSRSSCSSNQTVWYESDDRLGGALERTSVEACANALANRAS